MALSAILWDLGNTLVDWNPRRLYSKLLPSDAAVDDFLGGVCTMAWHSRHDAGVPMARNRQPLMAAHPGKAALIEAWDARWDEMFDGPVETMDTLVAELAAAGYPQYGLSNLPAEKWGALLRMYPFLDALADTVVSGQEGVIKPDPHIYEITKQRVPFAAGDVLFVDDRAENIDAARQAGFLGHVFTGEAELRRALADHGVPVRTEA
ncbi:haloacid dehalogenase [Marinicauda pacifica]|nr:HAD family phosphatase [Marinicauda pacifica]GGE46756.1 haloacid dehalogenase [Marinicauda pacifica]